ncbi:MAG TPA: PQQ-binding-like beta-propeller repeat protein [Vicinamibacterales bacterium]|nr:PQQ-binding-like beta-propeller repeat protein [Vicinamibacterales bacterium]
MRTTILGFALTLVAAASLPAQTPMAWPSTYTRVWKVEVGEGYSSPVLSGGRVFVHSRRDPQEVVTALDAKTGAIAWQSQYPAAFNKNGYAVRMGKGPNATPLVAGGRVFTIGASGHVHAWDEGTGKPLWSKDFSSRVDTSKLFCGTSASPTLVGGAVIVQIGSDVHGGSIVALDPATGAAKWEWKGDGPGYATPVSFETGGVRHLVTLTNKSVVGLNAATGALLWSTPFPDEWMENIVTPVWTGSRLIVSGVRQGTHAYRLAIAGNSWAATEMWKNPDVTMYMSTPVVADGVIYGLSSKKKGQFVALDSATGALKWATEGREGEYASLWLTPLHVAFLTNTGTLVVARQFGDAFHLEKTYELTTSETWARPVITGGDLIVRDATSLNRLTGK